MIVKYIKYKFNYIKPKSEKDNLWMDNKNKIIYYTELKANLKLLL